MDPGHDDRKHDEEEMDPDHDDQISMMMGESMNSIELTAFNVKSVRMNGRVLV